MKVGQDFNPFRKFTGYFIPECLMPYDGISTGAKLCLSVLYRYIGNHEVAWPSQDTIAKKMGCSLRSVSGYITELTGDGFLRTIQRGLGDSNLYVALWHRIYDEEVADPDTQNPARQNTQNPARPFHRTEESQAKEGHGKHAPLMEENLHEPRTPMNGEAPSSGEGFSSAEVLREAVKLHRGVMPKRCREAILAADFSRYSTIEGAAQSALALGMDVCAIPPRQRGSPRSWPANGSLGGHGSRAPARREAMRTAPQWNPVGADPEFLDFLELYDPDEYSTPAEKSRAEEAWRNLTEPDLARVMASIPAYLEANDEPKFRKRVDTYLTERVFEAKPRPKPKRKHGGGLTPAMMEFMENQEARKAATVNDDDPEAF